MKNTRAWKETIVDRIKIAYHRMCPDFNNSLFGAKFQEFIMNSYDNLQFDSENLGYNAPLFSKDYTILRMHEKYFELFPGGEEFIDFEVYGQEDGMRMQHYFKMEEENDIIKNHFGGK
jgi:hypothetical protein